jgi:hypothetical protein
LNWARSKTWQFTWRPAVVNGTPATVAVGTTDRIVSTQNGTTWTLANDG